MKFLHTGDWHLGKRLERFDRMDEQEAVLEEICALADREEVDLVLLAGDLFDTFNPPNQAIEAFYLTLRRLSRRGERAVVAIAGNHDSPRRIAAPQPLARANGIILSGYPNAPVQPFELDTGLKLRCPQPGWVELQLPKVQHPVRLLLTPYANEVRLRKALEATGGVEQVLQTHWAELADKYADAQGVNLLMTHLFMAAPGTDPGEEPEDERPILVGNAETISTAIVPEGIQYAALGHLHRYQKLGGAPCPVVYSGSLLSYSFAEAEQEKYAVIGEVEPGGEVQLSRHALNARWPLKRKTFADPEEAIRWLEAHPECYVELTLQTETFISGSHRRRILEAHPRVIGPIPEFIGTQAEEAEATARIDLSQGRTALFKQYVQHREGREPSSEMMEIFQEIISREGQA